MQVQEQPVLQTAQVLQQRFNYPHGITTDGTNLYVADRDNHKIRKIVISTGVVTTLAGSAHLQVQQTPQVHQQDLILQDGITTDGTNLYVADTSNHKIRKIVISTGAVTTLAGSGNCRFYTRTTGTSARFNTPEDYQLTAQTSMWQIF